MHLIAINFNILDCELAMVFMTLLLLLLFILRIILYNDKNNRGKDYITIYNCFGHEKGNGTFNCDLYLYNKNLQVIIRSTCNNMYLTHFNMSILDGYVLYFDWHFIQIHNGFSYL